MRLEPFESGQGADGSRVPPQGFRRVSEDRGADDEVVHSEWRAETNRSPCRKDVGRTGDIVSCCLRRQGPQEGGTGVWNPCEEGVGVSDVEREVFWSEEVRDGGDAFNCAWCGP